MKGVHLLVYIITKKKWSRYRPIVAQRVDRGIALLFHDRGTRRGWVVSSTPWPYFTPRERPGTHFYWRLGGPQGRSGRAQNLIHIITKKNFKLQTIPVIVSISICMKVWCARTCTHTLPYECYICVAATDSWATAMCTYLNPTCYMNCSWSEQFFVKYVQFNNVSLFSVLIFIYIFFKFV